MRPLGGSVRARRATADRLRGIARAVDGTARIDHKFVWIMGSPRTGSTWVAYMLAEHRRVALVDEPLIGGHLGVSLNAVVGVNDEADRRLLDSQGASASYVFADAHRDIWAPALADLLRARYHHAARAGGARYIMFKEPHGSEAADAIFSVVPRSRLLFLVRDPRDTLDSLLDVVQAGWNGAGGGRGQLSEAERWPLLAEQVAAWRRRVAAVRATYDRLPPEQRLLVRYEDLRADAGAGLASIAAWLGLPGAWTSAAADKHAFERVPAARRGSGFFHRAASPGLWRENFTSQEAERLTELLSDELTAFGYDAAA